MRHFRRGPIPNSAGDPQRPLQPGPTGQFPDGKLDETDEGEIAIGVTSSNGLVHVNFGKSISWFAFPPERAIEFAKLLLRYAGVKKVEITL